MQRSAKATLRNQAETNPRIHPAFRHNTWCCNKYARMSTFRMLPAEINCASHPIFLIRVEKMFYESVLCVKKIMTEYTLIIRLVMKRIARSWSKLKSILRMPRLQTRYIPNEKKRRICIAWNRSKLCFASSVKNHGRSISLSYRYQIRKLLPVWMLPSMKFVSKNQYI